MMRTVQLKENLHEEAGLDLQLFAKIHSIEGECISDQEVLFE